MKLYHELAEYYFAIENNSRDIRNDVSFILDLLTRKNDPFLIDLGCGTGEHLAMIAKKGIPCTGIDISEEMLAVAHKRFPGCIEFLLLDMTEIDYDGAFDMVICLFGSFNYLLHDADIKSTLAKIRRAMRAGALGVFEIWNTPPIVKIKEKGMGPVSATECGDAVIKRERGFKMREKDGRTVVEVTYRYTIDGRGGSATKPNRQ